MIAAWVTMAALAAAPVRFEAGPGCAEASAFEGLVAQADWELALAPEGNGWRLELSRGGARALVRALPAAASCAALAEAVGLMVERYFREVAAGRVVAPAPKPAARSTAPAPSGATAHEASPSTAAKEAASTSAATTSAVASARDEGATPTASATRESATSSASPVALARDGGSSAPASSARDAAASSTLASDGGRAPLASGAPASPTPAAASPAVVARPENEPTPPTSNALASQVEPNATPVTAPAPSLSARAVGASSAGESAQVATAATGSAPAAQLERGIATPPSRLLRNLELSVGAGALTQAFTTGSPELGAWFAGHAALHLGSRFRAGILAGASTATTVDVQVNGASRGTLWSAPFVVAAEGGICGTLGLEFCGSAVAGIRGAHGSASGSRIYFSSDGWLIRPDLGLLARAQWRSKLGFFAALEVWGAFPLGDGSLNVQGIPGASIELPLLDITASLQLGWSWQIL